MKDAFEVQRGSAVVRVYPTPVNGHESWTISYWVAGERFRLRRSSYRKAKVKAEEIATDLSNQSADARDFSPEEQSAFRLLKEFALEHKLEVPSLIHDAIAARRMLNGSTMADASRFYRDFYKPEVEEKTVSEAVSELLKSKESLGRSYEHLKATRLRLDKFTASFGQLPVHALTSGSVNEWLDKLKLSARTRNNYREAICLLVNFAKSRRYVPRHFDEMEYVDTATTHDEEVRVFTPEEFKTLLDANRKRNLWRYMAFCGLMGLRRSEFQRNEFRIKEGVNHIVIGPQNKVGKRRVVEMCDTASQIIDASVKSVRKISESIMRLEKHTGIEWRRNGMRHSFISYRLALTNDIGLVAQQAGTSPAKIRSNYLKVETPEGDPITKELAQKWFDTLPSCLS